MLAAFGRWHVFVKLAIWLEHRLVLLNVTGRAVDTARTDHLLEPLWLSASVSWDAGEGYNWPWAPCRSGAANAILETFAARQSESLTSYLCFSCDFPSAVAAVGREPNVSIFGALKLEHTPRRR